MTPKFPSPRTIALSVCLTILLLAAPAAANAAASKSKKTPAKPKAAAAKTAAKGRASARENRRDKAAARKGSDRRREERASKAARGKTRNERAAKGSKASRRDRREERAEKQSRAKDTRKMSKRERMAEARREAERRRREAAERARQIAIARAAAIARARAAEQALKEESRNNILSDETTGEDLEVRRVAVEALGSRAGSVVVMNPKTGQVYTVVNQSWALRRGFKPCSTIKLVTGLAGLNESVIDPVQTVNIGTGSFSLDLTDSLALSNNGYFQRVGGQVGFEKMMEYSRKFGLGQPTGINHPFENPGRLPVFKEGYAVNHMSSHGDDIEVTTIQLANMASTIANGGKRLVPHLPRTPQESVRFKREVKAELDVPQDHLRRLVPGMIGAVNYGTARRAYDPTQTVAGKTGTCTGQGTKLGLFTSYGPVHDPQLAVAVIIRGPGSGGKWAAAVAGDIYRRLSHRFGTRPGTAPMLANDMLAPRPKIDPSKAALVSDEERDDEAADQTDAYVVSESQEQSAPTNGATLPSLQKTSRSVQRPAAAPTPSPSPVETRPRRVNNNKPE